MKPAYASGGVCIGRWGDVGQPAPLVASCKAAKQTLRTPHPDWHLMQTRGQRGLR